MTAYAIELNNEIDRLRAELADARSKLQDSQFAESGANELVAVLEAKLLEQGSRLDIALGSLREIVNLPLAPSERSAATRRMVHVALKGLEPPK